MEQLICKNLKLGYEDITLTEDLSFSVEKGDYLCIVGENGAGKSTLMKTLLRLQKPLAGTIEYKDGLTASKIGYLPQQTVIQKDFPASVYEVVLSGCQNSLGLHLFYSREAKKRALDNMARLGISDLAKRCYRDLSGGQQQRVLLARALCATEKMLLLDEPMGALDSFTRADIQDKLLELHRLNGITMVLVTHDIDEAIYLSDRIVIMTPRPGKISNIIEVKIPHPRQRGGVEFLAMRRKLLEEFDLATALPEPEYNI